MTYLIAPAYRFAEQPVVRFEAGTIIEDVTLATTPDTDYYVLGDGSAEDLVQVLHDALESHSSAPSVTASLQADFTLRLVGNTSLQLFFDHANTTLDPRLVGWPEDAVTADALQLDSPNEVAVWRGGYPADDSGDREEPVVGQVRAMSGAVYTSHFGAAKSPREMVWDLVPYTRARIVDGGGQAYEYAWSESLAKGHRLRLYADETDLTTGSGYVEYYLTDPSRYPLTRDERARHDRWVVEASLRRA